MKYYYFIVRYIKRHPKKPLKVINRTNYFIPGVTRTRVSITSPDTYQFRQMKIEGYETRLYWQFKYCQEHQGQTFFYTLTYNDKAMPFHYGMNCFDYNDLRYLLTGGFRKKLLRNYGTTFKYFVGAELGDGKGERGMHNNPHYHILFFLEPANSPDYPYKVISPTEFRNLVRMYWQGFDEDVTGFQPYETAKFGIAREGDNIGLVTDFRAVQYVAKYVCKDIDLKANESHIFQEISSSVLSNYKDTEECYKDFFTYVINPYFNDADHSLTDHQLVYKLLPEFSLYIPSVYRTFVPSIIDKYNLKQDYEDYISSYVDLQVHEKLTEWRNRFSNKCRISHGVGDFAISSIDYNDPTIQVPSKSGFKNRPISLYYYRKIYCDVIKDKVTGSNLYVLNNKGIDYKTSHLSQQIQRKVNKVSSYLHILSSNPSLFDTVKSSPINTHMTMTYENLQRNLNKYDINEILQNYATYKLVYEDRYFKIDIDESTGSLVYPRLDVSSDYRRFITPIVDSTSYCYNACLSFTYHTPEDYLPYYLHPSFLQYHSLFNVLDTLTDYFAIQEDDRRQKEAEEIAAVRRFHRNIELKKFYSNFK